MAFFGLENGGGGEGNLFLHCTTRDGDPPLTNIQRKKSERRVFTFYSLVFRILSSLFLASHVLGVPNPSKFSRIFATFAPLSPYQ